MPLAGGVWGGSHYPTKRQKDRILAVQRGRAAEFWDQRPRRL